MASDSSSRFSFETDISLNSPTYPQIIPLDPDVVAKNEKELQTLRSLLTLFGSLEKHHGFYVSSSSTPFLWY
jgi:hypothetical protein